MKAEYITHYGSDLSAVNAARVSMNKESDWEIGRELIAGPTFYGDGSEAKWGPPNKTYYKETLALSAKDKKLISYLAKNKHTSCFEHQGVTLRLKVPLFVRSQIHRHRAFSYNEISRRYVKDDLEFYWPDKWRKAAENVKQGSSDEAVEEMVMRNTVESWACHPEDAAMLAAEGAVACFNSMVEAGVCAEQARMILPQNLYTQFYMTGNLRNWAHFLNLRLDPHAQREVQDVAKMCAEIIESLFPISYAALMEN